MDFIFFFNSLLLGAGLAMDAFSVSLANGLNEPRMKKKKAIEIAGAFAFFQALMPMLGWICVNTIVHYFRSFESSVPWIALILLLFIGGKLVYEGLAKKDDGAKIVRLTPAALLLQGVATSIDALSVGFTIAEYGIAKALTASLIIAAVTFFICAAGLKIGKKFGVKLGNKASVLGGVILIAIGLEIFITGII